MYSDKARSHAILRKSNAHDTAENLAAAAAVYGGYLVCKPIKVTGFYFYVTLAIDATTTAPVVEVNRRPTYNSSSGELQMASMTIPDATAAGKVVYKEIEPYLCYPGDEISFEHVTQAADPGTAAGTGFYGIDYEVVSESLANLSNLVASST